MIVVNTESIPGKNIVELGGLVQGNTVRAKHVGRDLMAGLKNIVGGELAHIVLSDLKTQPPGMAAENGQFVIGSMVVAADYFKSFASSLKTLIGGEMKSLQRMQERARREAILRMTEEAQQLGASAVMNVRIDTSTIAGKKRGSCAGVEVIASGTALFK